jgi:hypothetical protein
MLAAWLTSEQHLRARTCQVKVGCVDADGFGNPGASPCQEKQESPVTSAAGCCLVGRGDEGIHFSFGEMVRHLDMRPLYGDRQNALSNPEGRRVVGSDVVEEGSDGGQPGVTGGDGVLPVLLELVEKREDEVSIKVLEPQCRWLPLQPCSGEKDQHAQGVAIAGHGRGGRVALLGQVATKVGLQERRQEQIFAHAAPPSSKARSAAMARSSADPVR